MKCILCNERNGSTRCEGCQQLYCLPCMNKHHEDLAQQLQLLSNVRNELKQLLDSTESKSKNNQKNPCIVEINRWEQETTERIQNIATKARTVANEIIEKNASEVRFRFEQLSADIQRRQKEGNHLENDIVAIEKQLDDLQNDIEHIATTVRVDSRRSRNIEWDTLIYVAEEELPSRPNIKSAQNNSQNTTEKKRIPYGTDAVKSQKVTNPSSLSTSNKRASTGQNLVQVPDHLIRCNSPTNLMDFDQSPQRIRLCIGCKLNFNDLESTGLCAKCTFYTKHRPSHRIVTARSLAKIVHPEVYDSSDLTTPMTSSPEIRGPQKIVCPNCRYVNSINTVQNGMTYICEWCETISHATSS